MTIISSKINKRKPKIGKALTSLKWRVSRSILSHTLTPRLKSSFLDTKWRSKVTNFTPRHSYKEVSNLLTSIRTMGTKTKILTRLSTMQITNISLIMKDSSRTMASTTSGTSTRTTTLIIKTTNIEHQF